MPRDDELFRFRDGDDCHWVKCGAVAACLAREHGMRVQYCEAGRWINGNEMLDEIYDEVYGGE